MSEYGLKIKNIKAGTLFGYNQGIRDRYDYTEAMFSNSLFGDYIIKNGLYAHKGESTRDIICMKFDFGTRTYEEELEHLCEQFGDYENNIGLSDESKEKIKKIFDSVNNNKENYIKLSKDEIRTDFYVEGVDVEYILRNKKGDIKSQENIHYKMLYRSSAKAKLGEVMFINENIYDKAYDWMTMGLGKLMPKNNAKIVEMSAYAPLTTSTIIDRIHIPVKDILILKDQESVFRTFAKIVKAEEYNIPKKVLNKEKTNENYITALNSENPRYSKKGNLIYKKMYDEIKETKKKCVVVSEETDVVNVLWDGMGLIDKSISPDMMNGMLLLRNHFFKMCGFKSDIQLFFKDWCKETGKDYETYEILDMFGQSHKLKDIKVITTDNAIKWKKFVDLMGGTLESAYDYWCNKINDDGSIFGIVKTDHESKLGEVQQMSYQMVNTLPCTKEKINELTKTSIDFVEKLKVDNNAFEAFLRKNATAVNHYEMLADLYDHNHDFADSKWFRTEKRKIINEYVNRLRKGKIFVNADNLTVCGNPYALLLYSVGEDWSKDPTLNYEEGVIQCYTTRFNNGEHLCAIRNPHNSPNNICYLKNVYSETIEKYFRFTPNILAVNCIRTDVQSRANGMDFDSDFMFVTNESVMVECAKECYKHFPTIVNALNESGISYNNTMEEYAKMDNKFAASKMGIGESSNLAQLALTYYWTYKDNKDKEKEVEELYDNFVILSVLAQVIIDGCKREYEVDGLEEIDRIKRMKCMNHKKKVSTIDRNGKEVIKSKPYDYPKFMKYTKAVDVTRNGKERPYEDIKADKDKIEARINNTFVCPMNWMEEALDKIQGSTTKETTPTEDFFIKIKGRTDARKISKIRSLVEEYDKYSKVPPEDNTDDEVMMLYYKDLEDKFNHLIDECRKIKIGNLITINRLIETSLKLDTNGNRYSKKGENAKFCRKMLNTLYNMNKEKFLENFTKNVLEEKQNV